MNDRLFLLSGTFLLALIINHIEYLLSPLFCKKTNMLAHGNPRRLIIVQKNMLKSVDVKTFASSRRHKIRVLARWK